MSFSVLTGELLLISSSNKHDNDNDADEFSAPLDQLADSTVVTSSATFANMNNSGVVDGVIGHVDMLLL